MSVKRRPLPYLLTILLSCLVLYGAGKLADGPDNFLFTQRTGEQGPKAQVVDVLSDEDTTQDYETVSFAQRTVTFRAKFLEGDKKGQVVRATQTMDTLQMQAVHAVEKGDKLYLTAAHKADGSDEYIAGNFVRENWLLGLVAVFFLLMLLFGRMQGLNTILSLVLTCAAVFTVLVPAIASGRNIYLWTVLVCLFIVVMTLSIITGFTRKSAAAALGCLGGVCVAGLLTVFMNSAMKISGLVDEDTFMLASQDPSRNLDLLGIIFAAIVIGALGATMDVSMSISSSLEELLIKVPDMSFIELLRSGLRIGRDIMGTMANTLILAYVGSSLSLILLMLSYQNTTASLFNLEFIATEVLQALAGSIGILFTIPLTAISTGLLYRRRQRRLQNEQVC